MKHLLILIVVFIGACSPKSKSDVSETIALDIKIKYASKFTIDSLGITVKEPWPGSIRPIKYPIKKTPERIVVTSTTHLPFLEMLNMEDKLVGFPHTDYISSPKIRKLVEDGEIMDLGVEGNMNMELLIASSPDVVFAFDMGNESTVLDKVKESGISVIYVSDYLESSALGRAEWIKFFGAYFSKTQLADSIFTSIESRYDSLKTLTENISKKPSILSGILYGDTWFLPGGKNWASKFYSDAGGSYLWESDSTSGWLELSFESVFDKGRMADFWIGTGTFNSLNELNNQDQRYEDFGPFTSQKVYNYSKKISPSGGYDFFESGYARPDVVLADLIKILHPEVLPEYDTYYFQQLK